MLHTLPLDPENPDVGPVPKETMSPSFRETHCWGTTRLWFTKVPLVLPRSVTQAWSLWRWKAAWLSETAGSSDREGEIEIPSRLPFGQEEDFSKVGLQVDAGLHGQLPISLN